MCFHCIKLCTIHFRLYLCAITHHFVALFVFAYGLVPYSFCFHEALGLFFLTLSFDILKHFSLKTNILKFLFPYSYCFLVFYFSMLFFFFFSHFLCFNFSLSLFLFQTICSDMERWHSGSSSWCKVTLTAWLRNWSLCNRVRYSNIHRKKSNQTTYFLFTGYLYIYIFNLSRCIWGSFSF